METKLKGKTTIRCLYLALIELMLASSPNDDAVLFNHRKDSGLKYHPKELTMSFL